MSSLPPTVPTRTIVTSIHTLTPFSPSDALASTLRPSSPLPSIATQRTCPPRGMQTHSVRLICLSHPLLLLPYLVLDVCLSYLQLRLDTGFLAFLFPRSLGSGVYDEINGGQ